MIECPPKPNRPPKPEVFDHYRPFGNRKPLPDKLSRTIAWCAIIYLAVVNFPGVYIAIGPWSFDEHWRVALNRLFLEHGTLGGEVFFTYGPCGFLLDPRAIGNNLLLGNLFWLCLHCILILLLVDISKRTHVLNVVMFAGAYSATVGLGIWLEYIVSVLIALLACRSLFDEKPTSRWPVVAGALAAFSWTLKLSIGITALGIMVAGSALIGLQERRLRKEACILWGSYAMACLCWIVYFFRPPSSVLKWFNFSAEIVSGYTSAMSLDGPEGLGIMLLIALAILGLCLLRVESTRKSAMLSLLPFVFVAYKHTVIRQDGHTMVLFCVMPLITASAMLFGSRSRNIVLLAASTFALWGLAAYHGAHFESYPRFKVRGGYHMFGGRGLSNIKSLLWLPVRERRLQATAADNPANRANPKEWVKLIRSEGGKVTIVPWELIPAVVDGLPMAWLPTLQLYSAYTPGLDELTGDFFHGHDRPEWVWLKYADIDGRNPAISQPRTWRELLLNYELVQAQQDAGQMLLRKRRDPWRVSLGATKTGSTLSGEWVSIPTYPSRWRLGIEIRLTWIGRVAKAFYQIPPAHLDLAFDSGVSKRYRFITETAVSGITVPEVPQDGEDFASLLKGRSVPRVSKFRILLPKDRYFERAIRLSWQPEQIIAQE